MSRVPLLQSYVLSERNKDISIITIIKTLSIFNDFTLASFHRIKKQINIKRSHLKSVQCLYDLIYSYGIDDTLEMRRKSGSRTT